MKNTEFYPRYSAARSTDHRVLNHLPLSTDREVWLALQACLSLWLAALYCSSTTIVASWGPGDGEPVMSASIFFTCPEFYLSELEVIHYKLVGTRTGLSNKSRSSDPRLYPDALGEFQVK